MFLKFNGYLRNLKDLFGISKEIKGILRNYHERMPPYFVAIECY